jgi:hypothetical protein
VGLTLRPDPVSRHSCQRRSQGRRVSTGACPRPPRRRACGLRSKAPMNFNNSTPGRSDELTRGSRAALVMFRKLQSFDVVKRSGRGREASSASSDWPFSLHRNGCSKCDGSRTRARIALLHSGVLQSCAIG